MTPTAQPVEKGAEATRAAVAKKRRWLPLAKLIVTLAIGLGLITWLLWRVNLNELQQALANVQYPLLVLGIVGNLLTPCLRSERFRHLYQIEGKRREVTGILGQYGLLNMLLPLRAGDVAILGVLKFRRVIPTIAEALPRWIVLRVGDLAAVLTIFLVTALFVPFHSDLDSWMWAARIGAAILVFSGVISLVWMKMLPPVTEISPEGFLAGRIWALRRGLTGLNHTSTLLTMFGWSFVIWGWHASLLAIEYAAFDLPLAPQQLWAVSVAILAISILPIHAPLAIGTLHALQVGLLQLFDVPMSAALATAIGIHAAMVVTVVAQGLLGTLLLTKLELKPA
jgi:hypothetical protein